jgi:hypothetical protein
MAAERYVRVGVRDGDVDVLGRVGIEAAHGDQ